MPSASTPSRLLEWVTDRRNVTILVAILVGVPTAYAFQSTVGGPDSPGTVLLLLTLAVGVPTAYDEYWAAADDTWRAVAWVLVACLVATAEFAGVYLLGATVVGLSPLLASVGAFLVTCVGNVLWLAGRRA